MRMSWLLKRVHRLLQIGIVGNELAGVIVNLISKVGEEQVHRLLQIGIVGNFPKVELFSFGASKWFTDYFKSE